MISRCVVGLVALLAAAALSCRGCKDEGPADVRELAGAGAGAALVVDDLGRLVADADAFLSRLTRNAAGPQLRRLRDGLAQTLGLDPLDARSYADWGIETSAGAVVFTEGAERALILGVGVGDRDKFDSALKRFLVKVDGAGKLSDETVGPFVLHLAGRPFGTEVAPSWCWAHVGSFALVARAAARPSLELALARLARRREAPTAAGVAPLADDAAFRDLAAKLPSSRALLFVRGDAARALLANPTADAMSAGAAATLSLGADGLSADAFVDLDLPDLETAFATAAPDVLAGRVGEDAVVVALTHAAQPAALRALRAHPAVNKLADAALAPLRREVGLDLEKEVLPLLAGPLTLSVHLDKLDELGAAARDRRRPTRGLLDSIHAVITAEVTDPAAMAAVLERSRDALEKRGVLIDRLRQRVRGRDLTLFVSRPRAGSPAGAPPKLGWTLVDNLYVYAAGPGRLERTLLLLAAGAPSVSGKLTGVAARLAGEPATTVLVVRAGAMAEQAGGVDLVANDAQGIEALVGGIIELLRTLGDIGLALTAEPDGLRIKVRERLQ